MQSTAKVNWEVYPIPLILEDVGEALEENQRQDEVLELGRVRRPPDGAGCIPQPGLKH